VSPQKNRDNQQKNGMIQKRYLWFFTLVFVWWEEIWIFTFI